MRMRMRKKRMKRRRKTAGPTETNGLAHLSRGGNGSRQFLRGALEPDLGCWRAANHLELPRL